MTSPSIKSEAATAEDDASGRQSTISQVLTVSQPNTMVHSPGRDNFFEALPPEIREMIFEYISGRRCLDKMVIALRPQPSAYQQLLELYFKKRRFLLAKSNGWSFSCMSPSTRSLLVKLHVELPIGRKYAEERGKKYRYTQLLPSYLTRAGKELVNLRDLELCTDTFYLSPVRARYLSTLRMFKNAFPAWMRSFSKLNRCLIYFPDYERVPFGYRKHEELEAEWTSRQRYIDQQVGIKSSRVSEYAEIMRMAWLAPKGETMDWSCVRIKGHDTWNFWEVDVALEERNGAFMVTL